MSSNTATLTPELTVVVVILTADRSSLIRCLTSLTHQRGVPVPEIIVPCGENCRGLLALNEEFSGVRFLSLEGERTYAELRAIGVREARGRIVALTEDHCTPTPDWCAEILRAHEAPYAAIGGAVDKNPPDSALNWSFYLADYVRYMNPVAEGPANQLTDCNVSYKRAALEAIADVWSEEFHEPAVHGAFQAHEQALWLSPHIVVYQQRSLDLGAAVSDRYAFGRLFASTRTVELSSLRAAIYALLSFPLPFLLVGRVAGHVLRKRRCVGQFFRSLPYLMLVSTVWALGEFLGYVTGRAEKSLTKKTELPSSGQEATI